MSKSITRRFLFALALTAVFFNTTIFDMDAKKTVSLKRGIENHADNSPKIALGNVEHFRNTLPDAFLFTHIVYNFADFNENCDGIIIPKIERLKNLINLKQQNPELKIILAIGGDKREGFCEMTSDKKKRSTFVRNIKNIIDTLNLDGVNLDWEFPTTTDGGHTASPDDNRNYVKLVKDLRKTLGKNKWISFYSHNTARFIDLKRMAPHVDYVHASGYNLVVPKEDEKRSYHQSPLYSSEKTGDWCVKKVMERHIELGVPPEKLLMGIPFYGRGKSPFPSYVECNSFDKYSDGTRILWDEESQAPYYADKDGNLLMGYDDERSIKAKFDFIRINNLPGIFIWNYDSDYDDHRLAKTIHQLRK